MIDLEEGDCRVVMGGLEAGSFSTCITDPPYELAFMGKAWDRSGVAFDVDVWRGVLRLLKPGGMLLAFGGTRTFHRMVCAIEDAGFEVRDTMVWLYGSGFPKSMDVSKAIDKAAGAEREVVGESPYNARRPNPPVSELYAQGGHKANITAPATDAARLWNGYGTALKPAHEPICVAMKPIEGTFAANALEHGVAGLNIDGARIGKGGGCRSTVPYQGGDSEVCFGRGLNGPAPSPPAKGLGRFPSNVLLDEEAARMLDSQAGERTSGSRQEGTYGMMVFCGNGEKPMPEIWASSGGPSRFFYTAKASSAERGRGNRHPTVKPLDLLIYLATLTKPPEGEGRILDPFMGSGSIALAAAATGRAFTGIDLDPENVATARARLEGHRDGKSISKKDDREQFILWGDET